MLRGDMRDSDIPHRTKVRSCVMERWDEHLDALHDEMKASTVNTYQNMMY